MSAQWPTAVASDTNLYLAVNELQNNLSAGISNAVTTVGLNSTTSFPTVGLVLIDNEVIKYAGISGTNLTGCTRGFDGTTAASHSSGAVVSYAICADYHNVIKNEIEAIETYLSNNLGTGSQPLSTGHAALASNASGKIVETSTTDTELGYVHGVTSAIQTQLGTKAPTASPTFTGTIGTPLTGSRVVTTDVSGNLTTGAATMGGSLTFTPTTAGIVGTTTNDNAAAGNVGQRVSSSVLRASSITNTTTNTWYQLTSISLTAGDWDVSAICATFGGSGFTDAQFYVGTSSTASDLVYGSNMGETTSPPNGNGDSGVSVPNVPLQLSGTTTVYLLSLTQFTGGTSKSYGTIRARRIR